MRRPAGLAQLIAGLALGAGCSSSTPASTPPLDAGHHAEAGGKDSGKKPHGKDASEEDTGVVGLSDARPDVIIDPMNCVAPGTTSNVAGVGGYCSPGGGQCAHAIAGGLPSICTADTTATPMHDWFCTIPCSAASDCGAGVSCIATNMGQECIPSACVSLIGDAALSDSPSDGPGDGSTPADAAKMDGGEPDAAHDAAPQDATSDH